MNVDDLTPTNPEILQERLIDCDKIAYLNDAWCERQCYACKRSLLRPKASSSTFLCPDCRSSLYEGLAAKINPNIDATKVNDFDVVAKTLLRLWCWPNRGMRMVAKETGRTVRVDGVKVKELVADWERDCSEWGCHESVLVKQGTG